MASMTANERHFLKGLYGSYYTNPSFIRERHRQSHSVQEGLSSVMRRRKKRPKSAELSHSMSRSPAATKTEWGTRVMFSDADHVLRPPLITIQPPSPSPSQRSGIDPGRTGRPISEHNAEPVKSEERHVIVRSASTESHDNPFQPEGDIYREAEAILKKSTISRSEVVIVDPNKVGDKGLIENTDAACKDKEPDPANPDDLQLKENGKAGDSITPISTSPVESLPSDRMKQDDGVGPPQEEPAADVKKARGQQKCCVIL